MDCGSIIRSVDAPPRMGSRDKRSKTPGAADKLVKYLRALFKWAIAKKTHQA
jgi:hypothetical protein